MKKFIFPLDNVLNYKEQTLESLKNQHAMILKKMKEVQAEIDDLKEQYKECAKSFQEKKTRGFTVNKAYSYELYLYNLLMKIEKQKSILEQLKVTECNKKEEVIEARKETVSIEKLREKMEFIHKKEVQKGEELFIEEFVSNVASQRR